MSNPHSLSFLGYYGYLTQNSRCATFHRVSLYTSSKAIDCHRFHFIMILEKNKFCSCLYILNFTKNFSENSTNCFFLSKVSSCPISVITLSTMTHPYTPKLPNQTTIFIRCSVLVGWFLRVQTRAKKVYGCKAIAEGKQVFDNWYLK